MTFQWPSTRSQVPHQCLCPHLTNEQVLIARNNAHVMLHITFSIRKTVHNLVDIQSLITNPYYRAT